MEPKVTKIKELKEGMKVHVDAKVISKSEPRIIQSTGSRVCTLKLEDDSGVCNLAIYNDIIETVKEGDKVLVRHGFCKGLYQEEGLYDVTLGKFGQLKVLPNLSPRDEMIEQMNREREING